MTITQKRYVRSGFSLMELMVVILILGLLGAVVGPAVMKQYESAQKRTAKATIRAFKDAISTYQMHLGHLPPALKDLIKKPSEERDKKKWEGPYIEKEEVPEDPWGERFVYKVTPGAQRAYELYSRGPNKEAAAKEEWISVWDE
jgi:general secretion pathway protein G